MSVQEMQQIYGDRARAATSAFVGQMLSASTGDAYVMAGRGLDGQISGGGEGGKGDSGQGSEGGGGKK